MTTSPDWRENLLGKVDKAQRERQAGRRGHTTHLLHVRWEIVQLIRQAAELRGISVAGYCRRAIAGQLSRDLDMDAHQILLYMPVPAVFGSTQPHSGPGTAERKAYVEKMKDVAPPGTSIPDDGEGFGDWGW